MGDFYLLGKRKLFIRSFLELASESGKPFTRYQPSLALHRLVQNLHNIFDEDTATLALQST